MTHELQVSMLAAPLAAIDRRSLSQAWYSALRLGTARQTSASERAPHANAGSVRRDAAPASATVRGGNGASSPARVCGENAPRERSGIAFERRSARTPLAVRIASSLREPSASRRTAFRAGTGEQRVLVMLQASAGGARLVAVCAPKARAAVERALAQARFALAARGIELACAIREAATCF